MKYGRNALDCSDSLGESSDDLLNQLVHTGKIGDLKPRKNILTITKNLENLI